jgi:uncharacterized membrane protein YeaQ/YmgE (transglycosylase-associated protein family)
MSFLAWLISTFFLGIVVGGLARLALPGRDPMSLLQTAAVGVAGSWGAGIVVALISGGRYTAGFFASFLGAFGIVYVIRRRRGGSLTQPGDAGRRRLL